MPHADDFPARTQIASPGTAISAPPTSDQGIQDHALSGILPIHHDTSGLVSENQRWNASFIMTVIGVHVGATDATGLYLDHDFLLIGHGIRLIPKDQFLRRRVDMCFHEYLFRREAAIDGEGLTGDVSRRMGSQKQRDTIQILQFTVASDCRTRSQPF